MAHPHGLCDAVTKAELASGATCIREAQSTASACASSAVRSTGSDETSGDAAPANELPAASPPPPARPPPPPLLRRSSLDRDCVEGYMVMHVKKPRKALFSLAPRPSFFVVADARKPVLEVFANESKRELIYVLALAHASLSFESDDANMVMEKCFCVEAKTWKKRNTVAFKHQGFVFFEESQVRMLLWVKCIHLAIKKASSCDALDGNRELFRSSNAASGASDGCAPPFSDDERYGDTGEAGGSREDSQTASGCAEEIVAGAEAWARQQSAVRRRLVIDPNASIPAQKEPRTPFNRLNAMFSTHKQQLKSPKSQHPNTPSNSEASSISTSATTAKDKHKESKAAVVCSLLSPKMLGSPSSGTLLSPSSAASSGTKNPFYKSSSSKTIGAGYSSGNRSQHRYHAAHSESSSVRKRVERSSGSSSPTAAAASASQQTTDSYYDDVRSSRLREYAVPPKIHRHNYPHSTRTEPRSHNNNGKYSGSDDDDGGNDSDAAMDAPTQTLDTKVVFVLSRCLALWVAFVGGIAEASIFLPIAAAGVFAHVCRLDDEFLASTLAMLGVYLASRLQGSLGIVAILVTLYLWCYAEFKNQRRIRRVRVADRLLQEESESFAHVDIPNWICHPDVDRVEWLNKVFVTGWPYLKIAIRNSLMGSLNPLLDSVRPAFMSSLSLVRIDLGTRTPHISGVKFVSANPLTEEVTLDVEVRVVTDESLVAELRMVSNLGAAAVVSLRDLFLVGTLRITLNPLCVDWPCFSALSLSFTNRPVFDFSLTAAKINISNVPFASEWLHTFLHDLLNDYFVWPKVVHIPLWDENAPVAAAPVATTPGPASK